MTTCNSCGWEIHFDFGKWVDALGNTYCDKNREHSPQTGR